MLPRAIVHLDADAFFASVEQAADPRLRGKPIAVGGEKRGIIASASYEARKFGIYTPMPTAQARRLCPRLILLPGDFEKYELFSRLMFSYAYDFTPEVEIGSIDEGYFDLTANHQQPAVQIALTIRHAIGQALKLTVSEGIASNKLVSAIASKLHKPAAFKNVPGGEEKQFLHPLPNRWLPGVGPKTAVRLNAAGLADIGQIAATPVELLSLLLGRQAPLVRQFANGIDERPLVPAGEPQKSFSQQETFEEDVTDEEYVEAMLRKMADQLFAAVRQEGRSVRTLTVKVRYNDRDENQRAESLREPTDLETDVYGRLRGMLREAWQRRVSLRMVSLKLSNVYAGMFRGELPLDTGAKHHEARERLARTLDELRRARGWSVVLRGHDLRLRDAPAKEVAGGRLQVESCPNVPVVGRHQTLSPERRLVTASTISPFPGNGPLINTPLQPLVSAQVPCDRSAPVPEGHLRIAQRFSVGGRGQETISPEGTAEAKPDFGRPFGTRTHRAVVPNASALGYSQMSLRDRDVARRRRAIASQPGLRPTHADENCDKLQPATFNLQLSTRNLPPPPRPQSTATYIPLRVRSFYSFLDSTLSPAAVVRCAEQYGLSAVALTDLGNLHGAVELAQAAKHAGIKPIFATELRLNGQPLLLYVESARGYHNLCRLLSQKAQVAADNAEGAVGTVDKVAQISNLLYRRFPTCQPSEWRTALELPGLSCRRGASRLEICDTADWKSVLLCPPSCCAPMPDAPVATQQRRPITAKILEGFTEGLIAVSSDASLAELFPGRFYQLATKQLRPGHFPVVACPAIHYAAPADRLKYDIVQSIRTLTLLRQQHPEKRLDNRLQFRTPMEMAVACREHPEWLANSLEIADRCRFELPFGKPQFPAFAPPDGSTSRRFLHQLVFDGLRRRYGGRAASLRPQVEQELNIITAVGYEEYFLVVWNILQDCRRQGIDWITRGSAADSLVCYCLGISDVCPIRFGLYFRRFLNQERMALNKLPDIDVDFPHDRKDDVVDLIFAKYKREQCAVVGGFSTFQARSAFADVAKVLGVAEREVRRFTEHFPWGFGGGWVPDEPAPTGGARLRELLAASPENRDLPFQEEPFKTALDVAEFLDGFPRYPKMHPCGVVLSRQPIHELTPTFISNKGYPTTHFDMDAVEAIGLVKIDILAHGGLAVMRDVKGMIELQNPKAEIRNPKSEIRNQEPGVEHPKPEIQSSKFKVQGSTFAVHSLPCAPSAFGFRPSDFGLLSDFGFRTSDFPSPSGPFTDPEVWSLISSGQARAVHHIESPAMTGLCRQCNVRDIDTLIAIVSVIRPGAANEGKKLAFTRRYQGLEPVTYPHPSLEPVLRDTFGLVVYEEHILQICETFAGLPPGRADVLRRALNKQKRAVVEEIRQEFFASAQARGHGDAKIAEVWGLVSGFAGYAFCKAHSTAYGVEAYQSAWLKRYYPAEFMAAVLSNGKGFYDPLVYVLESRRLGLQFLPPSVNEPGPAFSVTRGEGRGAREGSPKSEVRSPTRCARATARREEIRNPKSEFQSSMFDVRCSTFDVQGLTFATPSDFGLRTSDFGPPSIRVPLTRAKGLTEPTIQRLLAERQRGPFASLADFYRRVKPLPEEMEIMIRAGGFDEFGQSRTRQFWEAQYLHRAFGSLERRSPTRRESAASPAPGRPASREAPQRQHPATPGLAPTRITPIGPMSPMSPMSPMGSSDKLLASPEPEQAWLLPPPSLEKFPGVPLREPTRRERLEAETELFGYAVSGHPLELFADVAWDTYCPVARLGQHVGETVVTCGLVVEQRTHHQITGEPMKFLTLADWTGIVETELFAQTYKSYGLATVRYPVLEITAIVEPFENARGFTLRVLRAGKPRTRK